MSALDQPIFIANSNYHVGHEVTFRVAEEQGFFKEEGLTRYLYAAGGLIPGPFEREHSTQVVEQVVRRNTLRNSASSAAAE